MKWLIGSILVILAVGFLFFLFGGLESVAVLTPKGWIGMQERDLIVISTLLMLIVVVPVFILTLVFMRKYRRDNSKAKYTPEWAHSHVAEIIWWSVPFLIIFILSVLTWQSSHDLDPFKPIESEQEPLTIQVVALQWKWLFIYPKEGIATVNFFEFPEKRAVKFEITADAPMNSFWIPKLGGQVFAMSGMTTQLHLIADEQGAFHGCSANLSGKGFSGMTFIAKATSQEEFERWVEQVKSEAPPLDYARLMQPSENDPAAFFTLKEPQLYNQIVMKFMTP